MAKNRRAIILIAIGVLLVAAAAFLYGKNVWEDRRAGEFSKKVVGQMKTAAPFYTEPDDTDAPSEPLVEIDGNVFCGRIIIETAAIELPVFADWNEKNLIYAPCRYSGAHLTDDLIIAAHNYKSHFRDLDKVDVGDSVVFCDAAGVKQAYQVRDIARVDGTAVEDMYAGEWDLTLFTCTPGGKQRLTLRCVKG